MTLNGTYALTGLATLFRNDPPNPRILENTIPITFNKVNLSCGVSCSGSVGDFVWQDLNGDGIQDPGEPGIPNVTVNLYNSGGTLIATDVTDANGFYLFQGLCAGGYNVAVEKTTLPSGLVPTTCSNQAGIGNNSNCSPSLVTLPADNSSDLTIDFGYVKACVIPGVTISNTSWNKFNIPSGTSPYVWVHAHIGKPSGVSTTTVSTVLFRGVSLSLNGTPYALPDGLVIFDPAAPPTITTIFKSGRWETTVNPHNLSDEIFFTGAAIPVTPAIAAGAKATLSYTVNSSALDLSFSWQWSAAVYTYWPTNWNDAQIQPYHQSLHAGTPLNTTVQKSLIQGPRGGGGSNFTGSWSATGTGTCP